MLKYAEVFGAPWRKHNMPIEQRMQRRHQRRLTRWQRFRQRQLAKLLQRALLLSGIDIGDFKPARVLTWFMFRAMQDISKGASTPAESQAFADVAYFLRDNKDYAAELIMRYVRELRTAAGNGTLRDTLEGWK